MRKPLIGIMLAGALCVGGWLATAEAQDPGSANQEPSLAEAARRAKAERKSEPQAKKVWTDEDIPKTPHEVPAEGGAAAPDAAAATGDKTAAPAGEDENKKKADLEAKWRQKFVDAHKRLDDDQKDLDLMQREYNLKQQQYYNDPNTAMRQQYNNYAGGRGPELNDLQKKMEEKKLKIEQDKQAISDLEDQLRKEGLPSGWARP